MSIKEWEVLSSREIFKSGFFSLRSDQCKLPDGRVMPNYYVCSFTNWVQVVPVTKEGKFVMVKQYRHAVKKITIEFPGGATGSHDPEHAKDAGLRELHEETGYASDKVQLIGRHNPNPAMQNNELFTFLALDCEKKFDQKLDPFEDIEVLHLEPKELMKATRTGEIDHSLVIASLFYSLPHLKGFD